MSNYKHDFAQTLASDPAMYWRDITPSANEIIPNLRAVRCSSDTTLDVTFRYGANYGDTYRHNNFRFLAGETRSGVITHIHSQTGSSDIEGAS